ncbi:hypothetical protein [Paracoccus methylarcula]|nr:hypothetical protein [Paracoccus methylarcula]
MNNQIAIILALLIVGLFVVDHFWLHMDLPLLVGKEFNRLVDYVVFWR